jgi:hypothetical protein
MARRSGTADGSIRIKVLEWFCVLMVVGSSCTGNPAPPPPRKVDPSVGIDIRVTRDGSDGSYVRFDGGTDAVLRACSRSRFPQNEPSVAIDPRQPKVIVVGANEGCPTSGGHADWVGFYRSIDGGSSWSASLVPGYPGDDSTAGRKSPASRFCAFASDPAVAFDTQGRLFFGFVCVERKTLNSSTLLASYDQDGRRYRRTIVLARGQVGHANAPVQQDKINVVVDQTAGPTSGNVYAAWTQYAYQPSDRNILVAGSDNHGRTFSPPVVATRGQPGLFPDLAIGSTGTVYLSFRGLQKPEEDRGDEIGLVFSPNGGRSFTAVSTVARIRPFDSASFSRGDNRTCGDGLFKCASGFTFPRFISISAVAADRSGVHVVWTARRPDGQAKIFVRNSPDGVQWPDPPVVLDPAPRGHQLFPDVASAGGVITVVFHDTRSDAGYSPHRPPGNDAKGRSTGNFLDVYAATSADGGRTWTVRRATTHRSNMDYKLFHGAPVFGDYLSVSAVPGMAFAVWTDTRDLRPGAGSPAGGFKDEKDGFDVAASHCRMTDRACTTAGGLDQNIYGAVIRTTLVT